MKTRSGWEASCKVLILKSGERGRNRTFNLLIKSQLLCQLSYAPTVGIPLVGQTKIIASRSHHMRQAVHS